MNIVQRLQAPTPLFFVKLRNIGLAVASLSGALLAAPATLPAAVIAIAHYAALAGGVMATVSQATTLPDSAVREDMNHGGYANG